MTQAAPQPQDLAGPTPQGPDPAREKKLELGRAFASQLLKGLKLTPPQHQDL